MENRTVWADMRGKVHTRKKCGPEMQTLAGLEITAFGLDATGGGYADSLYPAKRMWKASAAA